MAQTIRCSCGYVGPYVAEGQADVCPICRTPVTDLHRGTPPQADAIPAGAISVQTDEDDLSDRQSFRIPCPNGHVNVAPARLLGTEVVCPKCNAPYTLQIAASLEYRAVADRRAREREEKEAKKWLNRAIFAAIFIVVSLVGMIVFSLLPRGDRQSPDAKGTPPATVPS